MAGLRPQEVFSGVIFLCILLHVPIQSNLHSVGLGRPWLAGVWASVAAGRCSCSQHGRNRRSKAFSCFSHPDIPLPRRGNRLGELDSRGAQT